MNNFERVANIVPLTRVKLGGSQFFTYLVPVKLYDQLRPGQLVKIPLGRRSVLGIVSSFEMHRLREETKKLKSIVELLDPLPALTEKNLQLANWLAGYYVTPLGLVLKAMLLKISKRIREPEGIGYERYNPDFVLTEYQRQAGNAISGALGQFAIFLLHGVTGSGKTEVYMQIMEQILPKGKQCIILVPEISLTAAAIERFSRRFGRDSVAALHSRLKPAERNWVWRKIREGKKQIIIGPRSAVFAPVRDLGLVVMDEEHDPSFKQYDQSPKYHARDVAKKLAELWQCPLILGDATPSVETYAESLSGQIRLLTLPHRIKADVGLPRVKLVDMRRERLRDPREFPVLGEYLKLAILDALKAKKQIILFVGRRGAASFIMCRDCGHVPACRNCSVSLVWHSSTEKLLCHHCGRAYAMPVPCPVCEGVHLKHFGVGTETVEGAARTLLEKESPSAKKPVIVRMDQDTAGAPDSASKIYEDWAGGKIDILIGTQMITKGWDVGRVGLVGVVSADTLLHLPDFRANERTFQVLTQVAGRAGRGGETGLVILQTYEPDNYAIEAAKTHDYDKFFQAEIKYRESMNYPPFSSLVKLTIAHSRRLEAERRIHELARRLTDEREPGLQVLGPVPSFIYRLRGKYQYQIILKIDRASPIDLYHLLSGLPAEINIDVDPDSLL